MRTPLGRLGFGVAVVGLVVALAAVPLPVSAHVNDVGVDSQVSADGTVIVETAFVGADGFVVLHEVDGDDPGDPIGHAPVSEAGGLKEDVTVTVADETWQNWRGDRRVWAVLHSDDGDGTFEPGDDEMLEQFGDPAGERFTLERSEAPAYVTAREFSPQASDDGNVTIRAAALPEDGHVVVHEDGENGTGEALGATALSAGTSHNATVELDDEFFRNLEESATLTATLYADDGNGASDEDDRPVRAGDDAVATRFGVEKNGTLASTETETEADHGDGHDDEHDHAHSPTGTATAAAAGTDDGGLSATDGAGVGPFASLVAVALVALAVRRRR
jgi:hypothetical protein